MQQSKSPYKIMKSNKSPVNMSSTKVNLSKQNDNWWTKPIII